MNDMASVRRFVLRSVRPVRPPPIRSASVPPVRQPPESMAPMTFEALREVADDLRTALADFDPERLSGPDAARLLEVFSEIEKLAAGGKLLAARRVESSNVWRRTGHRSAAAHVAEATGTGLGPAITTLQAARQLGSLPATDEAMREGRLSETQVKEIAGAAILQPEAEQELVEAAGKQPMTMLKLRCRRVKAVGQDQQGHLRRHPPRPLSAQLDRQRRCGAVRRPADPRRRGPAGGRGRVESRSVGQPGQTGWRRRADARPWPPMPWSAWPAVTRAEDPARNRHSGPDSAGTRRRSGGRPSAMVHVRVDHAALVRGHLESGEICEIPGIGPIPVEVARRAGGRFDPERCWSPTART